MLELAETVARTMAEAGASPAEIAAAIKQAMGNCKDPAVAEELAVTMAKAMAESGASGADIVKVRLCSHQPLTTTSSVFPKLFCKIILKQELGAEQTGLKGTKELKFQQ